MMQGNAQPLRNQKQKPRLPPLPNPLLPGARPDAAPLPGRRKKASCQVPRLRPAGQLTFVAWLPAGDGSRYCTTTKRRNWPTASRGTEAVR